MKLWVALFVSATMACGGKAVDSTGAPPWTLNTKETIAFEPTLVDTTRYPTVCGVMNPPFMNGDLFSLDIVDQRGATPYAALTLSFSSPAPAVGTPLMLTVQPFPPATGTMQPAGGTIGSTQNAQGSGIDFDYSQGAHPTEIDPGAFDAVTITILALPTADGQPLTVRIQMHFVDGKTLDETFSNSLVSGYGGCGAG